MYTRSMLALLLVLTLATAAGAKMETTSEGTCPKPDPLYRIEVGDHPDHVFQIGKVNCTYTKPFQIGGIASVGYEGTFFAEITGKTFRSHGVVITTMANGDKVYGTFQGKGSGGSGQNRYTITGGTGKLTGIKGKGTSKTTFAADGTETAVLQGTYTLPK